MNKVISKTAGGIVVNRQTKKIALIQMEDEVWGFPKGRFKKGEKIIDVARREIYEETGISDLELIKKLPTYERPHADDKNITKVIYMHLFYTDSKDLNPQENDIINAKWVDMNNVSKTLSLKHDKEYFTSLSIQ